MTGEIEIKLREFESMLSVALEMNRKCVRVLREESDPHLRELYSERLGVLGTNFLTDLEGIVSDQARGSSTRFAAARVWAQVGGVRGPVGQYLRDRIVEGGAFSAIAAKIVADFGSVEFADAIQKALQLVDVRDSTSVLSLLGSMEALGAKVSEETKIRLLEGVEEWVVPGVLRVT